MGIDAIVNTRYPANILCLFLERLDPDKFKLIQQQYGQPKNVSALNIRGSE
jgi:hypothetical protein